MKRGKEDVEVAEVGEKEAHERNWENKRTVVAVARSYLSGNLSPSSKGWWLSKKDQKSGSRLSQKEEKQNNKRWWGGNSQKLRPVVLQFFTSIVAAADQSD